MKPRPSSATFVGGVLGIAAVIALGEMIHLLGNGPLGIDIWWHDLMLAWRADAGLAVARALEFIGGSLAMTAIGIGIAAAFVVARRPWDAITFVVAMLAVDLLTGVLKVAFARPRPEDSLSTHAMTAFPSGHTSLAAAVAVVLALLIRGPIAWGLAAVWITAVAWSRTYLEAHWLSDVIAGAALGASVALLTWATIESVGRATEAQTFASASPAG